MKVAFGADHAGFELKQHLIETANALGHDALDLGTNGPESVDYPDFAVAAARAVLDGRADLGVVICSNGVGISITANKVPGIRCALCHTSWGAARARQHTDANMLALGGLEVGRAIAADILAAFLSYSFEGGRHAQRVAKLMAVERDGIAAGKAGA
ncbi:MAG: ribose 5-phosphate isomerase B [Thermoflexaceae bacterium]|nr:ribose 5-phosphate isomerase B [Thermoflexaceae bacterium]